MMQEKKKSMDFLSEAEKNLLALYIKRMTFEHALDCTDGGQDEDQAYRILSVMEKVQEELAEQGIASR